MTDARLPFERLNPLLEKIDPAVLQQVIAPTGGVRDTSRARGQDPGAGGPGGDARGKSRTIDPGQGVPGRVGPDRGEIGPGRGA
jgi:hypothetical protein